MKIVRIQCAIAQNNHIDSLIMYLARKNIEISIFFHFLFRFKNSKSMQFFWATAHYILTIFVFLMLSHKPGARNDPGARHDPSIWHNPVTRHDPGTQHDMGALHVLAAGVSHHMYVIWWNIFQFFFSKITGPGNPEYWIICIHYRIV